MPGDDQSSTLPPVRRTCPVILFVGQVNHAKSHVRLSGDDISYFFMPVSPYLVSWLRELHVIVQCRICAPLIGIFTFRNY